jgi:hypothetical protein
MKKQWSTEEDNILKEFYFSTPREILLTKLNRTWKAIRCRAVKLKLKRDPFIILQENKEETKKALINKYNTPNIFTIPEIKEKIKQTNIKKRGVPYPTQSQEVKEKIKNTLLKKYNVDNISKLTSIKEKIKQTLKKNYNTDTPLKNSEIKEKAKKTTLTKYGVYNIFQLTEKIKKSFKSKYNYEHPLQIPEIKEKKKQTSLLKYGTSYPTQNPLIQEKLKQIHSNSITKEKKYTSLIKNKNLSKHSKEELQFLEYLYQIDPNIITQILHPILKHVIDFYSPLYNLWIQYDGAYWHGKLKTNSMHYNIYNIIKRDEIENELIPNLIRFNSNEVNQAIKNNTIINLIKSKIKEKITQLKNTNINCYQYIKKIEYYKEDIEKLPFEHTYLKASDFILDKEPLTKEIKNFIKKYEWLGTIGNPPKWCFTARYKNILGGVVLINEPLKYSSILGKDTPKYEAIIQRGASASWTPKNLSSRLLMFACNWMVNNTEKRIFVGYADPLAGEKGIIYQACNFDYLGDNFGCSYIYQHPNIEKPFTEHDLKRTYMFKKWCKDNNIKIEKEWIKDNGIKNLKKIPSDIKEQWYSYIKNIIKSSKKLSSFTLPKR